MEIIKIIGHLIVSIIIFMVLFFVSGFLMDSTGNPNLTNNLLAWLIIPAIATSLYAIRANE